MTAEFEIFRKDLIKLNVYNEVVVNNAISLEFFLDSNSNGTDYINSIHNEDAVMNRYGCFNISEEKNTGFITIRPALIKMSLKIILVYNVRPAESKTLSVYRNGKTEVEKMFDINSNCSSIELIPYGEKYIMKINYADTDSNTTEDESVKAQSEVQTVQNAVSAETAVENTQSADSSDGVQNMETGDTPDIQKLEAIKAESQKDYEHYAEKINDLKESYKFDKALLEYYKDKDLVPIEKLFSELEEKIKAAEEQIVLFINERQNKTKEIEES